MTFALRARMNFAILLVLVMLATMGWFSYKESRSLAEKDRWVSHSRDVLDLSESLRSHFTAAGAARHAYVTEGDPAQVRVFDSESSAALAIFTDLRRSVADNPTQEVRVTELEVAVRARVSLFEKSIELHERMANDEQGQEAISEEGVNLTTHAVDELRIFEDVERGLLQQRVAEAESIDRRATRINEFLGLSVFLFLILGVWIVNRELSRRSRAEIATGKERKLLESILNSCSDVVVVADEKGKIILRNPAADRLYRKGPGEELTGNNSQSLGMYRENGEPFAHEELPLVRAVRGESVEALELCVRHSGNSECRYFLAAGAPLLDTRGNRRGGVIFLRDITERKLDSGRLAAALIESERVTHERSELAKLTDLFQSCHGVEEACKVVNTLSFGIFDSRPGMLCLTNASRNLVESCASWGNCSTSKEVFEPSECWGLRQGKPYVGGDATALLRCPHVIELGAGYLCVPLAAQGETYGVLYVENKAVPLGSSIEAAATQLKQFQSLATAVAERISSAVANLRLREVLRDQSIQDPLTGLFNRRYLEESLDREVHRASRAQRSVALVMLDIDHFKQFNDTFGHQSGDMILREVAAVFKARVRAGDLACRYGGEEFALVLAETDAEGARACIEKIREAIKQLSVEFRGQSLGTVTISAGIAVFPKHSDNSEGLIHIADLALYRAKKEGRNRVVVSEQPEAVSTPA